MANEKMKPQSPEEIARAAQEAALKQMRAMMGSIPGISNMPDMGDMQAQIMAQMQAAVPNLAEIQAQQAAMGTLGGVDAAAVAEAARQNMAQATATMQAMQDGSLERELREANAAALDWLGEDDGWEIKRAEACRLTAEQCRLMAFAAPLLVYNDEAVDAVESEVLTETYSAQLQSWWNSTDRDSPGGCSAMGIMRMPTRRWRSCAATSPKRVIPRRKPRMCRPSRSLWSKTGIAQLKRFRRRSSRGIWCASPISGVGLFTPVISPRRRCGK